MKVVADSNIRQKILVVEDQNRVFALEYPMGASIPELYGVAEALKEELWNVMEKQRKEKEDVKEPEEKKEDSPAAP